MSAGLQLRPAGARGILVQLPGNATARKLAARARDAIGGLEEVVAGHETVLLVWEPGRTPPTDLAARLQALLDGPALPESDRELTIAVRYDGPDLSDVAAQTGLSAEEVVRRHLAAQYTVGFVGFAPGFAYLLGGDPLLRPSRRPSPRLRVPAGSLAIAGEYTALYPAASPGGWQLIGMSDAELFRLDREPPAPLTAGTRVRFVEEGA